MKAETELKRLLPQRERLMAQLAQVDRRIGAAALTFSKSRGYMFPLRPEQIKRELEVQR